MDKLNTPIKILSIAALVTLTLTQGKLFVDSLNLTPSVT